MVSGTIGRLTEFWSPQGGQSAPSRELKARLIPVNSEPGLSPVDIYGGNARIGRDAALATIVINDRRVSRYHARISEEGNGVFRLWDEGSTSGTYVNHEQVSMSGRVLRPGDLVNFGPLQFHFEYFSADTTVGATQVGGTTFTDATEPFVLTPPTQQSTQAYDATNYDTVGNTSNSDFTANDSATVIYQGPEAAGNTQPMAPNQDTEQYTKPIRNQDDSTQIYPDSKAPGKASSDDRTRA
jgi:hypothetical protein